MKKLLFPGSVISLVALAAALFLTCGCETGGDTVALTVTPSYVDLTTSGTNLTQTQTFTVTGGLRELSLPLEWRVSNQSLGAIAEAGGTTASYITTGVSGDNSIIVEDQYGAEGVATIRQ